MDVEIRELPPIRVAYLRGIGPYPQVFPTLWPKFSALAGARGLFKPGVKMISVCHDHPGKTPPDQLRGDACVSVDDAYAGDDVLNVETIPAGKYAVAKHIGAYRDLHKTWASLGGEWISANGYRRTDGPAFEIYVNNPMTTSEAELLTEIHIPIA